jgi:hypothetical protein
MGMGSTAAPRGRAERLSWSLPESPCPWRLRWVGLAALLLMTALVTSAGAQEQQNSELPQAEIQTTLRSYYFNLAHHDWEALTADILAAKVVAHRPAPDALVASAPAVSGHEPAPSYCASDKPRVDDSDVLLDGDWAEVSVPHCRGSDEFRLIHFERRWRIVYSRISSTPSIK